MKSNNIYSKNKAFQKRFLMEARRDARRRTRLEIAQKVANDYKKYLIKMTNIVLEQSGSMA